MINIKANEKVLMSLRRHWVVLANKAIFIVFLLIVPPVIFYLIPAFLKELPLPSSLFWLLSLIYYLFVFLYTFVSWADYYLDVWIITDKRIIDSEQIGLFKREVSEFRHERVQDVTVDVKGVGPTLFGYGNIHIQTAGEARQFIFWEVPNPYKAKDLIAKLHEKHYQNKEFFYKK